MICPFCKQTVDPDSRSTYRKVIGWEKRRKHGGANTIPLREETGEYAHYACVQLELSRKRAGVSATQLGMLESYPEQYRLRYQRRDIAH